MSATALIALIARCRALGPRRSQATDAELLQRFTRLRNAAAFEELLERHAPLVWGVCRRILPGEADCEDAFQATFLALVRQAGSLDPNQPLGGWLHTVALRAARKAQVRSLRPCLRAILPDRPTPGDVADDVSRRELFRAVDEEIERLPALLRLPVILCCLEGRTRDEAAEKIGCSVAAVKSRLERGRSVLRTRLERRGIPLPAAFLVLGLTADHVRASLRAKALQSVLGTASPAVAALVPAAAPSLASKLILIVLPILTAGVLGFGAFRTMQADPSPETPTEKEDLSSKFPQPPAAENTRPGLDRFGDPLPPGAVRRFGTLRFRHDGIRYLAFTPDGKRLIASGVMATPLAVFDAATGRKLRTIGKSSPNNSGAFALSPDGKRIVCCGLNMSMWDLENGRLIRELHCGRCTEAAFSPDGAKVATIWELNRGGDVQTGVVVMETATGERVKGWTIKEGKPLEFGFHALAFSPDGKCLAGRFSELRKEKPFVYGIASSHVWLLDATTGARLRTFGLADVPVLAFAFQPNNGQLATLGKDSVLRFWDVGTGKEVRHFQIANREKGNKVGALRFSADGKRCAVLTNGAKLLIVLDAKNGRVLRRIEGEESWAMVPIAFSTDGRVVAVARCDEPCVRVWDVASGVERLANAGHRAAVTTLSLSADGRTLASRDGEGRLIHWNLQNAMGEVRPSGTREEIGRCILSRDYSERILRGPRWRMVYKYQEPAIMEVRSLDGAKLIRKTEVPPMFSTHALSPDGTHLAITVQLGPNYTILLWDPEREEKPRRLQGPPNVPGQLLFSHDGKRLISASGMYFPPFSGTIWIWDVATARVGRKVETRSALGHLLLSADDRLLFAGGGRNDATVHVWDMETGKELVVLADPSLKRTSEAQDEAATSQLAINCLALSPDERFLAVVTNQDDASIVSVWETASWKLIRAFAPTQPRNHVQSMVFSRDGRSLFAANSDSTILQWDVSGSLANGRRQPAGETLNKDRLNILWRRLTETPDKAYPATWELLDHPAEAVPFLIGKVSPVKPVEEKRVRQLLARLDSDSFAEREEASRQLLALGGQFLPMLHQALKDRPSLEMKRRVEGIMESLPRTPSPDQLRLLRALAVLEWSETVEAERHLHQLADGVPSASFTHAAKATLQRRKH